MLEKSERDKALRKILDYQSEPDTRIVLVMMGGDGGLVNTLSLLKSDSRFSSLRRFHFLALPFGSGNDGSRVHNWGATYSERHLQNLHYICLEIAENTTEVAQNIWDVHIELDEIWRVGQN